RVARLAAEGRGLALPLEADGLAVLDEGGQLDADLAPVGEERRDLLGPRRLLDADVERDVDVGAGRAGRLGAGAGAARRARPAPERLAEQLAEDVTGIERVAARPSSRP